MTVFEIDRRIGTLIDKFVGLPDEERRYALMELYEAAKIELDFEIGHFVEFLETSMVRTKK